MGVTVQFATGGPSDVRGRMRTGWKGERVVRRPDQGKKERRGVEGVEGVAGREEGRPGPPGAFCQVSPCSLLLFRSQRHLPEDTSSGWNVTEDQFLSSSSLSPFAAKSSGPSS